MVEKCVRCGALESEIKLFDTIYEGKAQCICERCSIIENVSILERPTQDKIKESNRVVNVYERMRRLTGMAPEKKESEERKNRLEELRKNPQLEIPEKRVPELIDHFHWEIMKCRRRKGLSHNQLGEAIGEPGFRIELIEKGNLGENPEELVKKLERFFNIRLIKLNSLDLMKKNEKEAPILLDEDGNVLETIPEPATKIREEDLFFEKEFEEKNKKKESRRFFADFLNKFKKPAKNKYESESISPVSSEEDESISEEHLELPGEKNEKIEDLDLEKIDKDKVKISDLREWHARRVELAKTETVEDQKRIEERNRIAERRKLIDARKEELRLIKEKDSKEIDNLLGGSELLKNEVLSGTDKID
ncbi:MAG: hypothetical protein PHF67_02905 [Candidatus Nanoarchaeia archaeon]|nr:hypothetical protein [Candidatus Nanoarchaeia archaeon]